MNAKMYVNQRIFLSENKAVYTTAPVADGWVGAEMIWAGAVMVWAGAVMVWAGALEAVYIRKVKAGPTHRPTDQQKQ